MSLQKESGAAKFFRVVAPKLTSVGAAVVIVGALFKIMHWPGAGMMLTVGLLTEAFLFFIGAFQPAPPPEAHYEWEKVYPELAGGKATAKKPKGDDLKPVIGLGAMDKMLKDANLSPDTFKSFGEGMKSLQTNVNKMKDISNASVATDEYAKSAKTAAQSLSNLSKSYSGIVNSMTEMSNASKTTAKDAKTYVTHIQATTKSLQSLNAVYEMQLKDGDQHIKAMNKFYGNLASAMENMADASKESEQFKKQMVSLTSNLTSLNSIYGNMLTAMKGK